MWIHALTSTFHLILHYCQIHLGILFYQHTMQGDDPSDHDCILQGENVHGRLNHIVLNKSGSLVLVEYPT